MLVGCLLDLGVGTLSKAMDTSLLSMMCDRMVSLLRTVQWFLKRRRRMGQGFLAVTVLVISLIASDLQCGAEELGPKLPAWMVSPPSMRIPPWELMGQELMEGSPNRVFAIDAPSSTIERVSGEEKGPRIPEPMVFDLVRPLGAKRGEAEFNTLGRIPLMRKARRVDDVSDPLGFVRRSQDRQGIEWAPEIEYVLTDGLAVEFELPLENVSVEAYKAAGQATFGTLWDHRFIHGAQVIAQYNIDPRFWTTTWLYLAGFRIDKTWSVLGMFGPRFEHGSSNGGFHKELLSNVTLFADVTNRMVAGVETNFWQVLGGHSAVLVMPQVHYEVDFHWMIQGGIGVRITNDLTLPEIGFRLIREF